MLRSHDDIFTTPVQHTQNKMDSFWGQRYANVIGSPKEWGLNSKSKVLTSKILWTKLPSIIMADSCKATNKVWLSAGKFQKRYK